MDRATVPGFRPNLFLLNEPRPPSVFVSNGAEPSILADRDGDFLWIGDTGGMYRSEDDGATWQLLPNPFNGMFDGISLAQDEAGTLFAGSTLLVAIQTARSTTDGSSWDNVQRVADVSPIADRPWIAATDVGRVALVFYDFGRTFQEICMQSTDGGFTFIDRSLPLLSGPPNAGNLVFDDDGAFYYSVGTQLYRRNGMCRFPVVSLAMYNGVGQQVFTQTATDGEYLYSAAPTGPNTAMQVAGTKDFTTATVKRLVLSQPLLKTHTFATLSTTANEVAVAWYASETAGNPTDPNFDGSWNVFVARITGFWTATPTTTYVRLTDAPNHVGDICMAGTGCGASNDRDLLDYFMIDHGPDGRLHVAYGHDGSTSNAEVRYAVLPALP